MSRSKFTTAAILIAAGISGFLLIFSVVRGLTPDFALGYQVFLAAITALFLLSLKLPHRYRANLVLAVYSTAFMSLAGETFFEIANETNTSIIEELQTAANKASVNFDTRTRTEVILEARAAGLGLYADPGRTVGIIDGEQVFPLGRMSRTPIILCNELGEWFVYETDERGFNNPIGIWGRDQIDLVSIGDSFTWGACVPPDSSAPALIRTAYPDSLNLGMSGTGSLEQLAVIKEYLGELQPKTVLWFYFEENDLSEMIEESKNVIVFRGYLESDDGQDLASRQSALDHILKGDIDAKLEKNLVKELALKEILAGRPSKLLSTLERRPGKAQRLRRIAFLSNLRARSVEAFRQRSNECQVPEETFALFDRVVNEAQRFVSSWNGEIYFIYLPSWARYGDPGRGCSKFRDPLNSHDRVVSIAESAGLEVIDLSDTFKDHPDPLSLFPFRSEAHYNEDGYAVVAETVLEKLMPGR